MWNLKSNTNEYMYISNRQTYRYRKRTYSYQRGVEGEKGQSGSMRLTDKTTTHKIDKQQEFAVQNRLPYLILCNSL